MKNLDPKALKSKLTIRYSIALGIIAFLLILSFFFISNRLQEVALDAKKINQSGFQRMLTKSIALEIIQITKALATRKTTVNHLRLLKKDKNTFYQNHKQLVESIDTPHYRQSQKLKSFYLDKNGLVHQAKNFIADIDQFIKQVENNHSTSSLTTSSNKIISQANGAFISNLNTAVNLFQETAEKRVEQFRLYAIFILVAGLLTLILEIFIIFRPMVHQMHSGIKELANKNKELTTFSYRLSHDIRAPVASALGLVDVAIDGAKNSDTSIQIHTLNLVKKGMTRLDGLIHDILELTKTRVGEVEITYFSLETLVNEVLLSLQHLEGFSDIKITKNFDLTDLQTDQRLLRQILLNLISNAIKYKNQDRQPEIVISSNKNNRNGYSISVQDNGLGIPEDKRQDLFEMFKRFHPKKAVGSGLGLYLVRQSAESLGGDITYSPLDCGSNFTLTVFERTS